MSAAQAWKDGYVVGWQNKMGKQVYEIQSRLLEADPEMPRLQALLLALDELNPYKESNG